MSVRIEGQVLFLMRLRGKLSQWLMFIGCLLLVIPFIEIFIMQYRRLDAIHEWQVISSLRLPLQDSRELLAFVYDERPSEDTLFATLDYLEEDSVPIYQGIKTNQLKKGLGHDPLSVLPGELGNCLIYGHREEFLWELQRINIGDYIFIQTIYGKITYQVQEIKVLDPQDAYIFEQTSTPQLTIVTCHPFIFWGPVENRFVVRAILI